MNWTTLILEWMPYGIAALGAAVAIGFLRVVGIAARIAAFIVSGASKLTSPWSSRNGRSTAYMSSRILTMPEFREGIEEGAHD